MGQLRPSAQTLRAIAAATMPPAPSHDNLEGVAQRVMQKYPALRQVQPFVVDSRGKSAQGRGLEYYQANTDDASPLPSQNTIELFDKDLEGQWLEDAVAGDSMHGLASYDPRFAQMRQQFRSLLTPEQVAFDRRKFDAEREPGDTFDNWMERSWLDAYIRGYLFPDKNDEWRKAGVYTPEQTQLLEQMRAHITGKR